MDHIALTAAGLSEGRSHDADVLYGGPPAEMLSFSFKPVERERARAWLATVVTDLLGGAHPYFLPCEAVLRLAEQSLDGAAITRSLEQMRDRKDLGSSRYGPVPDPERRPIPAPEDAIAMVERRFGLLFELWSARS